MILSLLGILFAQVSDGREIELWTRPSGSFDRGVEPDRSNVRSIDLARVPQIESMLFDVQLEETRTFRGLTLAALLDKRTTGEGADTALLHFANGMIVPVPLGRPASTVFVALAIGSAGGAWERTFPEITKRKAVLPDPRPIVFGANKIVVSEIEGGVFSPWHHVDTLVGIELVRMHAYDAQFEAGVAKETRAGMRVFLHRCSFCHAVRDVGGTFGWDLIDPVPLYSYRTPQTLHAHVKYDNADALERGYMMPAQKDIERSEIDALWIWLKAVATDGLKPYAP